MIMAGKTEYILTIKIVGDINDTETLEELQDAADLARETFFANVRGEAHGWIDIHRHVEQDKRAVA